MGWQMEVFRMFLYITFPVATFHYFNNPHYYEKSIKEMMKPYETPGALQAALEIENFLKAYELEQQKQQLKDLEAGKSVFQ